MPYIVETVYKKGIQTRSFVKWSGGFNEMKMVFFCFAARPSESKWSPGGGSVSNSSLAHELWKVPLTPKALPVAAPSRPPPGLTSQKPSGWDSSALRRGGWGFTESRYTPGGFRGNSYSLLQFVYF